MVVDSFLWYNLSMTKTVETSSRMHKIINGILQHDGTPVFVLGQCYWGSFNEKKMPIAPGENRTEQMKLDLREMAGCGFNLLRTAALGAVTRSEDGVVRCDYSWPDEMLRFLHEELDMPALVRLQGYGVNFSGLADFMMLDQNNNPMPEPPNSTFLPFCVEHPAARRDNGDMTEAAAAHFRDNPAVVAQLIFNEPHYAWADPEKNTPFYDFNPHAIRAWRGWMAEKGYCSREEAESLNPLRRMPVISSTEEVELFTRWLLFRMESVDGFLGDMGDRAAAGNPNAANTTCQIAWLHRPGSAMLGLEYFELAERLDFLGITDYLPNAGPARFFSGMAVDAAESAAATFGKHAWLIEYNCRTNLPANEWIRETVVATTCGVKGVVYYNFRADHPVPGTPEPEQYGLIFSDRRRTEKYETVKRMNALVTRLQHYFVAAEKERGGIAILDSAHARAMGMAIAGRFEPYIFNTRNIYADLIQAGYQADFTRACDLAKNPLKVRALFIPFFDHLSAEEKEQLREFERNGGKLVSYDWGFYGGYYPSEPPDYARDFELHRDIFQDVAGVLNRLQFLPACEFPSRHLGVRILRANDNSFLTVGLVNTDSQETPIAAGKLVLRLPESAGFSRAELHTLEESRILKMENTGEQLSVELPQLDVAGYLIIR